MLKVNKSSVTLWTQEREPDYETVGRIERVLHMRRGQLLIEAGIVELPAHDSVEDMMLLDTRLVPMAQQMARENYRSLLSMSAESMGTAENDAPTNRRRMVSSAI